jgi:hypothetical protein
MPLGEIYRLTDHQPAPGFYIRVWSAIKEQARANLRVSRAILSRGQVTTLHRWLEEDKRDRNPFAGTLCPNRKAGPRGGGMRGDGEVEQWPGGRADQSAKKALKRQMYGRAGVELLRARVLPLPALGIK